MLKNWNVGGQAEHIKSLLPPSPPAARGYSYRLPTLKTWLDINIGQCVIVYYYSLKLSFLPTPKKPGDTQRFCYITVMVCYNVIVLFT